MYVLSSGLLLSQVLDLAQAKLDLNSNQKRYYSVVSIKNIDILPNRQYIANTADSAQEQYS